MIGNPWSGLRGLPLDVWVVAATTLVNRMGTMVLPFLVLYLTRHLGFDAQTAGLALAVYGLGGLIGAPLAGKLCDRVGPLPVMQGSLLASGAILLVYPLARTPAAVLALTLVLAVFGEAVRPASLAAITGTIAPEKRRAAIALNRLAINLGMSLGPAIGGFLAMVSFPLIFVVDGITSLAAALLLGGVIAWMRARGRLPRAAGSGAEPAAERVRVAGVLRDGRTLAFFGAIFLVSLVFFQHEGAMALYLVRDLRLPESFYGMLFVVNTLLIVFLEVPLNLAMGDWPHRRALVLGTALVGVGFGALALAAGPLGVVATVVVWTFGEMILFPVSATYVADVAPEGRRGEYLGAYSMTFGLAFMVGPWLGTAMLDRVGGPALWGAALLCGVAAAGVVGVVAAGPVEHPARAATPRP